MLSSRDTGSADGSRMREGGDRPVLQGTHARVQVSQQQVSEPPQDVRLGCLVLPALPVATGAAVPTAPI